MTPSSPFKEEILKREGPLSEDGSALVEKAVDDVNWDGFLDRARGLKKQIFAKKSRCVHFTFAV